MKTFTAIHDYYDRLAPDYDRDRFGNSYGRFVDAEERAVLRDWLAGTAPARVVDIGCGTGRLLDFAMTGVDASAEMLKVAAGKFPDRRLVQSALPNLDLADAAFDAATCFHVFMHLDVALICASLADIARVLKPGGRLIVDIPSSHRRSLARRKASDTGWHGETAASWADMQRWAGAAWRVRRRRGVLMLPIHRTPSGLRGLLRGVDALIGRTALARWASYHVYELERVG
jgi:ubiquinone/menaquinone biosynthesis C-methylase UbiE